MNGSAFLTNLLALQCGTVKSIKFTPEDGSSTQTAIIEFESHEDALYAKSKEAKLFQSTKLAITVGQGATLWVTNFPPTADEKFIRDHFGSVSRALILVI